MVRARLLVLIGAVAVSGCMCGRPNPRIDKISAKTSDGDASATFTYDSTAHLTKVEKVLDDGETSFVDLIWKDGLITEVHEATGEGALAQDSARIVLHHEDGRIVLAENENGSTVYEYDEEKRLKAFKQDHTAGDSGALIATNYAYTYDDEGALSGFSLVQASGDVSVTSKFKIERDDAGRLTKLTGTAPAQDSVQAATYDDDGRLVKLVATADFNDNPAANQESASQYKYDADTGFLASTHTKGTLGTVDITYTYGDGEANGLDVTSDIAYPFLLWDMRGQAYPAFETTKQPQRFIMTTW